MSALEEECLCLREISINLNKLFTLLFICPLFYTDSLDESFTQDYVLASHTSYFVCVNFIRKIDSELQIFEKLFMVILFCLRVFGRNFVERKSPRKYVHIFVFISDLGFEHVPYYLQPNS